MVTLTLYCDKWPFRMYEVSIKLHPVASLLHTLPHSKWVVKCLPTATLATGHRTAYNVGVDTNRFFISSHASISLIPTHRSIPFVRSLTRWFWPSRIDSWINEPWFTHFQYLPLHWPFHRYKYALLYTTLNLSIPHMLQMNHHPFFSSKTFLLLFFWLFLLHWLWPVFVVVRWWLRLHHTRRGVDIQRYNDTMSDHQLMPNRLRYDIHFSILFFYIFCCCIVN